MVFFHVFIEFLKWNWYNTLYLGAQYTKNSNYRCFKKFVLFSPKVTKAENWQPWWVPTLMGENFHGNKNAQIWYSTSRRLNWQDRTIKRPIENFDFRSQPTVHTGLFGNSRDPPRFRNFATGDIIGPCCNPTSSFGPLLPLLVVQNWFWKREGEAWFS